jgi:DNA-binding beta-propeller fold protein YncE
MSEPSAPSLVRRNFSSGRRLKARLVLALIVALSGTAAHAADRPYRAVERWARLPAGADWQTMSAVDIDAHGRIYALQRGDLSKVMVFSSGGRLLRTWGEGAFPDAHGLRIDHDDNVWITDRRLHQVLKFTPTGTPLMVLGTRGVPGDNDSRTALNGPSDMAFGANGDIFVSDGESSNGRVLKYAPDGTLLKFWGTKGAGPGQLDVPHSIVIDSRGRLYVADRSNKRVEIFDQDGGYLGQLTGVGTPYGLAMGDGDILYLVDGSKGAESLTIVNTADLRIVDHFEGTLEGAHMLAVDRRGAIYVAEVRGKSITKFVR